MTKPTYLNVSFDDSVKDDIGHWSQICQEHKLSQSQLAPFCSNGAIGICGVEGCNNDADFYLDLNQVNFCEN